jgi:Flp pilus assembly pilin Flp
VIRVRKPHFLRREEGQTMAEYSVILAVITPAIILAIALMATGIAGNLMDIVGFLTG